jgi:hypothetical protein
MDGLSLLHLGSGLTGFLFALALVWAGRKGAVPASVAGWVAAAFLLDGAAWVVAAVLAPSDSALTYLFASLHALVPVMILGGLRSIKARGDQSGMLLSLGAVTLGWIGASTTAGLGPLWIDGPVHVFRGLVFLACAWAASCSAPRRGDWSGMNGGFCCPVSWIAARPWTTFRSCRPRQSAIHCQGDRCSRGP